jgi:hypothetical protein
MNILRVFCFGSGTGHVHFSTGRSIFAVSCANMSWKACKVIRFDEQGQLLKKTTLERLHMPSLEHFVLPQLYMYDTYIYIEREREILFYDFDVYCNYIV